MKIRFNHDQLKTLSGITADAGQVLFAVTVVPFVFGIDRSLISVLPSGLVLTFICWSISIVLMKGYKYD